jgi:uncharacterized protein YegL
MAVAGKGVANRPLHFVWMADTSYSMEGDKIESLNHAIRDSIPLMQKELEQHPEVKLMVRAIKFSDRAEWVTEDAVTIDEFKWKDLKVEGLTAMGSALELLADSFNKMASGRGLRPVIVLLTDGNATDDFEKGLKALNSSKWGKVATRIAIGIGKDVDEEALNRFVGENGKYISVSNSRQLIDALRWASSVVVKSSVVNEIKKDEEGKKIDNQSSLPDYEYDLDSESDEDDWEGW